jgi:hypothetical protein
MLALIFAFLMSDRQLSDQTDLVAALSYTAAMREPSESTHRHVSVSKRVAEAYLAPPQRGDDFAQQRSEQGEFGCIGLGAGNHGAQAAQLAGAIARFDEAAGGQGRGQQISQLLVGGSWRGGARRRRGRRLSDGHAQLVEQQQHGLGQV